MHISIRWPIFSLALLFVISACGCAEKEDTPSTPPEMEISVDFKQVHYCSRISPEITVAYAPHGTKFYNVRLVENQNGNERFLGGGLWPADNTGIIPEGALSQHYTGPCPKANQRTEYVYVISAQETPESQPLAVRFYKFIPE